MPAHWLAAAELVDCVDEPSNGVERVELRRAGHGEYGLCVSHSAIRPASAGRLPAPGYRAARVAAGSRLADPRLLARLLSPHPCVQELCSRERVRAELGSN